MSFRIANMKVVSFYALTLSISLSACSTPINEQNGPPYVGCEDLSWQWDESGEVVLALALSGGGKRAAAFAYGVLLGLESIELELKGGSQSTLLDQVDVLTGVSGGSTLAAYYALGRAGRLNLHQFLDFLHENTEAKLLLENFKPTNWFTPRIELLAKHFDESLYIQNRFKALHKWPLLIIESTDLSKGVEFHFTRSAFNCIGSDWDNFPLGYAVAASASYPLFFETLPLRNYNSPASNADDITFKRDRDKIVPLSDGGLVDNLALRPTQTLIQRGYLIGTPDSTHRKVAKGFIFITIDGSAHIKRQFIETPKSPSLFPRMQRGLDIVFEHQVGNTLRALDDDLKKELLLRRKIPYQIVPLSLDDANNDVRQQLLSIGTRWTLSREEIDQLVEAGRSVMLSREADIRSIRQMFKSYGP